MTPEANQFKIELDRAYDQTLEDFLEFKGAVAAHVLTGVTNKMPVDTSRAKANTHVTIGTISTEWQDIRDPSGIATINKGLQVIKSDTDPFSLVHIQNNVPYIEKLEAGYSGQAPLGMMAVTLAEIEVVFP